MNRNSDLESTAPAAIAVKKTGDAKTGPIAATYASRRSCPQCPNWGICYGMAGNVKFTTIRLSSAPVDDPITIARQESDAIDSLPGDRPLRIHVVGDCKNPESAAIVADAAERYIARGDQPVYGYTHSWRDVDRAIWGNVSMLASCETVDDIRLANSRGYIAAIVTGEYRGNGIYSAAEDPDVKLLGCRKDITGKQCKDCRACMNDRGLRRAGINAIALRIHAVNATKKAAYPII